jgi:hypothetical protein
MCPRMKRRFKQVNNLSIILAQKCPQLFINSKNLKYVSKHQQYVRRIHAINVSRKEEHISSYFVAVLLVALGVYYYLIKIYVKRTIWT